VVKRIGAGLRCILEELVRRRVCRKRQPSGHHGWGVVKSLALIGSGPGLVHAQKVGIKYKKPTEAVPGAY